MMLPSSSQALAASRPARVGAAVTRVLLVEDDPFDARVMQQALHRLGFAPVVVPTLHQALRHLADGRFALVVLDLSLPDALADAALLAVEDAAAATPVVVVSGATSVLERLRGHRDRRWHLLDKNDLDLGMLAAVARLAVSGKAGGGRSS